MSNRTHNKKRNSILLYEFLVRTISASLVDGDRKKSSAALKILRKHFKPGTELYKEFRLMNSLVKINVSSNQVAAGILSEAKLAVNSLNVEKLDREKSLLIKSINHGINDANFYDQQVNDYRDYATLQLLFNEWRLPVPERDLHKIAQYEDQTIIKMLSQKEKVKDEQTLTESNGTSRLLMKVMTQKINEKYKESLNEQQKALIKAYAFSVASDDNSTIISKLHEIKNKLLTKIDERISEGKDNDFLLNKVVEVKNSILSEKFENIDDDTVTRFMLYSKLQNEFETEE